MPLSLDKNSGKAFGLYVFYLNDVSTADANPSTANAIIINSFIN